MNKLTEIEKFRKFDSEIIQDYMIKLYRIGKYQFEDKLSEEDIQDLLQETFIVFYSKIKTLELTASISTYLYSIFRLLALKLLKSKNLNTDLYDVNNSDFIFSDLDKELFDNEKSKILNDIINNDLDEEEVLLVKLKYYEAKSNSEIAKITGLKQEFVMAKIQRIKRKIKNQFAKKTKSIS